MNRINVFAGMGTTGIALAFVLFGISDEHSPLKIWGMVIGIISLLILVTAYYLAGREDEGDKKYKNTLITELQKTNKIFGNLAKKMRRGEYGNKRNNYKKDSL